MVTLEKRPGYDWLVVFCDIEGNELISGSIFGVMTAELAVAQAHDDLGMPKDCDILAIIRSDVVAEVKKELNL